MKLNFINQQNEEKGSSLVETMIAVSILSLSTFSGIQQSNNLSAMTRQNKSIQIYRQIASDISTISSSMPLLLGSLRKPVNFKGKIATCITEGASKTRDCANGENKPPIGIHLFGLNSTKAIAGPDSAPVYYGPNGRICNPSTEYCIATAKISIRPLCFNGVAACSVAAAFAIRYEVAPYLDPNKQKSINIPFWVSANSLPKPIVFEMINDTNLQNMLGYMPSVSCKSDRNVLKGLSFSMQPICVSFPPAERGADGNQGKTPAYAPAGPPGNDA